MTKIDPKFTFLKTQGVLFYKYLIVSLKPEDEIIIRQKNRS